MSRNILFLVTGMTPQIVAETIWALACDDNADTQWVPDEVHVLSTQDGLNQIRKRLFEQKVFEQFKHHYPIIKDVQFNPIDSLHVITDADGKALNDLKTPEDNERSADIICETIKAFTSMPDTSVHVSIAGGRKTMGFYAGYALSLYGRAQDAMSHVLVEEKSEKAVNFFYPTPTEHFVSDRDEKDVDNAQEAQVWLANIPFVRLRSLLGKEIIAQTYNFSQVVQLINDSLNPVQVTANKDTKTITANSQSCKLSSKEFSFYLWFLQRRCHTKLGISYPSKDIKNDRLSPLETEEFKQIYIDYAARNINIDEIVIDHDYFSQVLSNIDKKLSIAFLPKVYEQVKIQPDDSRLYQVTLDPRQINIIDY